MIDLTRFSPVMVAAPTEAPVTILEVQDRLKLDGRDEDLLIGAFIDAAVSYLDGWSGILGRCIMPQTWRQDFEGFADCMPLPFPDVQSVTVKYDDASGVEQTLGAGTYALARERTGTKLVRISGQSWPTISATALTPVRVTMVCGMSPVPSSLITAICLHVGHLHANRELMVEGRMAELPFGYDAMIAPHRRSWL